MKNLLHQPFIQPTLNMSLAVVIPVFNEEKTIGPLISDLHALLAAANIPGRFIIINDGSTDNSLNILQSLAISIPGIEVITHKNSGHGPSLLKGYRLSLQYDWVFQLDSDYQYDLSVFLSLWQQREQYDLLIAERGERNASGLRDIATTISQLQVKLLYGRGIKDINSPYRLIRTKKLALALQHIKAAAFAPNILIAAYFIKNKFSIFTTSVRSITGAGERKSKMSMYIFKGCIKSFTDFFLFRFKI